MWLRGRNRHDSYGAAAEVGAELQVSERLMINADMRWAELDESAALLRSDYGPVGADPVTVGVSVGWRFR
jgi:outer membrane protein W